MDLRRRDRKTQRTLKDGGIMIWSKMRGRKLIGISSN